VFVPPWLAEGQEAVEELAAFQGSLHALDRAVGRILESLEAAGLAQNTLVLFPADHGIPFPRAKHSLYEPGCQAAAIVR
jgi:arylsulfatase A-like enzyme